MNPKFDRAPENPRYMLGVMLVLVISLVGLNGRFITGVIDGNRGRVLMLHHYFSGAQSPIEFQGYQSPDLSYVSTLLQIEQGDYAGALLALTDGSWKSGRYEILAWQLGFALFQDNHLEQAVQVWEPVVRTTPIEDTLLNKGNEAENSNNLLQAESYYRAYALLSPVPERYEYLGEFYLRVARPAKAIQTFEQGQIVALEPMRAYLAGRIAEVKGNLALAADSYRRAIALGIEGIAARVHLAKVLAFGLGDVESAELVCRETTTIAPSDYQCYEILGLIYTIRGDVQTAIDWFDLGARRVAGRYATAMQSLFQQRIGFLLLDQGQVDQAETRFTIAIRLYSYNAEAYQGLANVYVARGDLQKVVATLQQAITMQTQAGKAVPYYWYNQLGSVYEQLGDVQSALQAYGETLFLNPQDSLATMRVEALRHADK